MPFPPNHTARVAHSRSRCIPQGDGAPSTHTQPPAAQHRMFSADMSSSAARPLAAPLVVCWVVVVAMRATVLGATVVALATILDGSPNRSLIVTGSLAVLALWCAALAAPAARRHATHRGAVQVRPVEGRRR